MIRDVMVFTPVYRLEPETVSALFALEWDGAISYLLQRDNPHENGKANTLHQYQRGREIFLAGSYDAMLIVESDIIPPAGALVKLAKMNSDLAYGVYRFRTTNVINIFERYPGKPRNEGESLSLHWTKLQRAVRRGVTECTGGGLGCVLIKRPVLATIPFRQEENGGHCDTYFNRDVMRRGFKQMADMTVICGHKNEAGEILWPRLS